MMRIIRFVCAVFCLALLVGAPTQAQEKSKKDTPQLGLEQKLKEVYQLYRVGEVPTLNQNQVRVGLSLSYAADGDNTLSSSRSSRSIVANLSLGYGLTNDLELSLNAPVIWSEHRVEADRGHSDSRSSFGFSNPTVTLIAALPTRTVQTNAVLSVTPPVGADEVSSDAWQTAIGGNVNWSMKPVFVYGGLSWNRDWKNSVNSIGYNAGLSLFLNHRIAAGVNFSGRSVITTEKNVSVKARDTMTASLRASYRVTPSVGINTTIGTGLTAGTSDMILGASVFSHF